MSLNGNEVQNAIFNEIEVQIEIEISTNLWIPLGSHIYSHSKNPWCTSFVMAPVGPSFYITTIRGGSGHGNERAVTGHFQMVRLVRKLGPGCLVCCQTLDNLIRDLIN